MSALRLASPRCTAAAALAAAASIASAGCGSQVAEPRPQWTVFVGTDAPLPQFGDRVLIEVLDDDGRPCAACRRQIGAGDPARWPLSFGVVPPDDGGGVRVRARLYRADHTGEGGLPYGLPVIDALARLPQPDAAIDVGLALSMSCLSVAADISKRRSCDPRTGALADEPELTPADGGGALPSPGSWPDAAEVPCAGVPPEGTICIPGGVFAIGDPYFFPSSSDLAPLPEHLVRLSPFAIDAVEVTVGQVRALAMEGKIDREPTVRSADARVLEGACTYLGSADAANDALPVNCVSRDLAADVCTALGKRLPTEAEWEFTAVNLTRETAFPWGDAEDACARSILSRGRSVLEADVDESTVCRGAGGMSLPWGPVAGGEAGDITERGVKNLAGNVDEWVADRLNRYDEPCWSAAAPPKPLQDPRCDEPSPSLDGAWAIRGGGWSGLLFQARSVERNASGGGAAPSTGFRCAISM